MTQKGKKGESENAIGRIMALRWEPTHVTKHTSRSVPLQCLPFSLQRCRMMGIRPAMASMPSDGEVWKAPVIQRTALYCIFFNSVMFLTIGAPLKNHS